MRKWGLTLFWAAFLTLVSLVSPSSAQPAVDVCWKPPELPPHVTTYFMILDTKGGTWAIVNAHEFWLAASQQLVFHYNPTLGPESLSRFPEKMRPRACTPPPAPVPTPPKTQAPAPKTPPPPAPSPDKTDNGSGKTGDGDGGGGKGGKGKQPLNPPKQKAPPVAPNTPQRPESRLLKQERVVSKDPTLPREPTLPRDGVLSKEALLPGADALNGLERSPNEKPPPQLTDNGGVLPELWRGEGRNEMLSVLSCEQTKEGCKDESKNPKPSTEPSKDPSKDPKSPPDSAFEKLSKELALFEAILNGKMNEDLHRPDGKEFGVIGGRNADGFNNPIAQIAASAAALTPAMLSQARSFCTQLRKAVANRKAFVIPKEMLSEKTAEWLSKSRIGAALTDAMQKLGVIGEYRIMKMFTLGRGHDVEAHHLLEKRWFILFEELGDHNLSPSVILTVAEHKGWNRKLPRLTEKVETIEQLWQAYKKAYEDHPEWLAVLRPYFEK